MNEVKRQHRTAKGSVITIVAMAEACVEKEHHFCDGDSYDTEKKVVKTVCHVTIEKDGKLLKEWSCDCLPSVVRPKLEHVRKAIAEKGAAAYFGKVLVGENDAQELERIVAEMQEELTAEYHRHGEKTVDEKIDEEEIALAERIVRKAATQKKVYSEAEIAEMKKRYNEGMNEGGEGYVPSFGVSTESLAWAQKKLARRTTK